MRLYKQISRRQAGVIYRAYKEEKINISAEEINKVYNLTEYSGYDDNGSMQDRNDRLSIAIDYIFEGDYHNADRQIAMAFDRIREWTEANKAA